MDEENDFKILKSEMLDLDRNARIGSFDPREKWGKGFPDQGNLWCSESFVSKTKMIKFRANLKEFSQIEKRGPGRPKLNKMD